MSFRSVKRLISSILVVASLVIMLVLSDSDADPSFFPRLRMVFHWSSAGGAGGGFLDGPAVSVSFPFPLFPFVAVLLVLLLLLVLSFGASP